MHDVTQEKIYIGVQLLNINLICRICIQRKPAKKKKKTVSVYYLLLQFIMLDLGAGLAPLAIKFT